MNDRHTDILCISESWLTTDIKDEYVTIPGYTIIRNDKGRGGGVCIYIRDIYRVAAINVNLDKPEGIEDVWITVQNRKLPTVIVGCLYRHPKSLAHTYDYIQNVLRHISLHNKTCYLLGDLNDNLLQENSKLRKIIVGANMTQMIKKPTRITDSSATLIDIVVTNKPDSVLHSDATPCPVGDHELISITIDLRRPKREPFIKTFRQLRSYSPDLLCNLLLRDKYYLDRIFTTDDIDIQVQLFTDYFMNCLNTCAPTITKEVKRPPAPWITDELKLLMHKRNEAQLQLKHDRENINLQDNYKALKRAVKRSLRQCKSQYYNGKLLENRGNTAATWRILKELVPNKNNKDCVTPIDEGGIENKVEVFNDFFANVGKQTFEDTQCHLKDTDRWQYTVHEESTHSTRMFRPNPIDSPTIILTIMNMKHTYSYGSDGIPLRFIKDSLPVIIPYLTCIINTSIVTGVVPASWKHAIVVPVHKSGDADEAGNYRPISLLPILSKILEKVIATQLTNHLEDQHILSNTQHGFRPALSTNTALLTLSDQLYRNADNKKISLVSLCDLSKAFDSVCHEILIRKLVKSSIDPFWFENYLKDRTQSVRLGNHLSRKQATTYGVPQGSVLGPILFNVYVNDLSQFVKNCTVIQYADDTQFIHTGTINDIHVLVRECEETLSKVKLYFHINGLKLNTNKTQCIFIGTRGHITQIPNDTCIQVDGSTITPSSSVKNLGIYFDNFMQFETHILHISKKCLGTLMFINRLKENFDKNTLKLLIQSLVLSKMNYGLTIWGNTTTTCIQQAQKVQNFAAKVVLGGKKFDHATPYLKELKWLKMVDMHKYELGVMVYNILNNRLPSWLYSLPKVRDTHTLNTRHQQLLHVPKTSTCMGDRSLLVSAPKLWNSLPTHIRNTTCMTTFKRELKELYSL